MNISLEFPFSLVPVHVWWTWSGDPTATFLRRSCPAKRVVPSTCTTPNTFPSCILHPARLGARPSLPGRVATCLILSRNGEKTPSTPLPGSTEGGLSRRPQRGALGACLRGEAGRGRERQGEAKGGTGTRRLDRRGGTTMQATMAAAQVRFTSARRRREDGRSDTKLTVMQMRTSASEFCGKRLQVRANRPMRAPRAVAAVVAEVQAEGQDDGERLRLNNLSPWPGSRRKAKRKGRGHAAGQGASCGFGMRGQKSRSGPGVRPGFEGGQMPLYRRVPKLKGIAGGMSAGKDKFVNINLKDIAENFEAGSEVSLESLQAKRVLSLSGREKSLPLKVLGDGEMNVQVTVKAAAFSKSAKEKLEAAGCTVELLPMKEKWTRKAHEARMAASS